MSRGQSNQPGRGAASNSAPDSATSPVLPGAPPPTVSDGDKDHVSSILPPASEIAPAPATDSPETLDDAADNDLEPDTAGEPKTESAPEKEPEARRQVKRDHVECTVAKGRTVQDADGKHRRAGESVRVHTDDYGRLVELGFIAKPERKFVAPAKKGPSVTRSG